LLGATIVTHKATIDNKALLTMAHTLRIGERMHRLRKGEIMNSIEYICLTRTIISNEAIYARRECYILALEVFEVDDG
jgi:hypothetical protein